MNRKLIVVLMIALLVLMAGCRSKNPDVSAPTDATIGIPTEENTPTETLHPALVENPFDDEIEETTGDAEQEETGAATEASKETEAPKATEAPKETEVPKETEAPTEPEDDSTEPPATEDDGVMTYEEYMALSAAEQSAFMNSFDSVEDFFAWFNAAKAEYDAQHPDIEVGDGSFDLGELEGNG